MTIRDFVNLVVTRLSWSRRANSKQAGYRHEKQEAEMPAYEICYLDLSGALTYKFAADCADDKRAKVDVDQATNPRTIFTDPRARF